ncbi:hypothetical protein [Allopontixanthobacter sediminis]|nr:hypothetical protein [Allopontixanthobacter sediminis]
MNKLTNISDVNPVFPIARNDKGQVVHQTPEQLSPYQIAGESDAAKYTRQVFAATSDHLARYNAMYMRRDPKLKETLGQHSYAEFDNARTDTKAEIKRHEEKLKLASNFKPDTAMTSLVVGTFQSMKPEERGVAVAKLIAEGDGPTLAILASVSSVYTGLGDEVKSTIADRLYSKADPQTYATWNTAKSNLGKIEAASFAMLPAMSKFANGPDVAAASPDEVRSIATGFAGQ